MDDRNHIDRHSGACLRTLRFARLHAMALGVIWVAESWLAVTVALALFWARRFAVAGKNHAAAAA